MGDAGRSDDSWLSLGSVFHLFVNWNGGGGTTEEIGDPICYAFSNRGRTSRVQEMEVSQMMVYGLLTYQ